MLTAEHTGALRALGSWVFLFAAAVVLGETAGCSGGFSDCTATRTCSQSRPDASAGSTAGGSSGAGGASSGGASGGGGAGPASSLGGAAGNTAAAAGAAGASYRTDDGADAGVDAANSGGVACPKGFADCNHRPGDGCEVNLARDLDHCGACDVACSADGTTDHACNDGVCNVVCDGTHADCNKDGSDGCEADLQRDADHCSACDVACSPAGATQNVCVAGVCTPACDGTHADCDKDGKNGCEADLRTDPDHCGSCGVACGTAGTASRACVSGVCQPTCDGTHADCNMDGKDGCEADVTNDPNHCGSCALSCSTQNVKARLCVGGACTPVCASGFDDCSTGSMQPNDGCETSLNSAASCGACGHGCLGGTCSLQQCQPLVLGSSLPTPHGVAVDAKYVHWVDGTQSGGRVMRVALTGGVAVPVNTASEPGPYDAASDGQYVYWSDMGDPMSSPSNAAIRRIPSGGNTPEDVVTAAAYPGAVVAPQRIVLDANNVYWGSGANSTGVFKVSKSGAGGPSEIPELLGAATAIAVDSTYVYTAFLDLYRSRIDGTGTPLHYQVGSSLSVAVDDGYVYYAAQDSNNTQNIYKIAKDFSGTARVVAPVSIMPTSPLVLDATYVYYTDDSNLFRVPKAGGTPQPLSNQVDAVFAIVVTKEAVYWSNTGSATADGSVMKLAL